MYTSAAGLYSGKVEHRHVLFTKQGLYWAQFVLGWQAWDEPLNANQVGQ